MAQELSGKTRLASVDALRGLIMIIMALDHTRDFFHAEAMIFRPDDLTRTTTAIFLTRWVTHICAPVFMFTAGLGAFFWLKQRRTASQLSRFLWSRGLWLMILELTALRLVMNFSLFSGALVITVLWALGLSMIVLGFLVRIPMRWVLIISVLTIALHNLLDSIDARSFGSASWVWNVVHQPGGFTAGGTVTIIAIHSCPGLR